MSVRPKVTVGVPVFNGEAQLALALESLILQDHPSFEVVISDNGSTDGTRAICEAYAARDPRVSYHRYGDNRGASWNFNNVVTLAAGEYFMWGAHDDMWAPGCLSGYARALDEDPRAVLVYCHAQPIDSRGAPNGPLYSEFVNDHADRRVRWRRLLENWPLHVAIYGMMRMDAVEKTRLIRNCAACDIVFMSELVLHGKTLELPDVLSWKRVPDAGTSYRTVQEQIEYLDPSKSVGKRARFLRWRAIRECLKGLRHAEADRQAALTLDALGIYCARHLSTDVKEEVSRVMRSYPRLLAGLRWPFRSGRTERRFGDRQG